MLGAASIRLGDAHIVLAGGMESMSNAPYYLEKGRAGFGFGHQQVTDAIIKDGLWDAQYQIHMGNCAEDTAAKFKISRESQDEHAVMSYKRSATAVKVRFLVMKSDGKNGVFVKEIAPVTIKNKGKDVVVAEDEEYKKVNFDKIASLKPVFQKDGTVTAANASTLNDGASAVLLMSAQKAVDMGLRPLARIICMLLYST
jgi:acetyl-CoA C-acetyltransferase